VDEEGDQQRRLFGQSHLVVTFDYEMIDGQPILPSSVLAAVVPAAPFVSP
jgi:hypothetical protein